MVGRGLDQPEVLVPAGWFTHESGEQWYWDGWGWRGNRADFEAALTPAEVAAQLRPRRLSKLAIPSGPDVLTIEVVGEDRHMEAITDLFDVFGHDTDELTIAAHGSTDVVARVWSGTQVGKPRARITLFYVAA